MSGLALRCPDSQEVPLPEAHRAETSSIELSAGGVAACEGSEPVVFRVWAAGAGAEQAKLQVQPPPLLCGDLRGGVAPQLSGHRDMLLPTCAPRLFFRPGSHMTAEHGSELKCHHIDEEDSGADGDDGGDRCRGHDGGSGGAVYGDEGYPPPRIISAGC